jgi:hypothetical protein
MNTENDFRNHRLPRPAYVRESDPGSWAWEHPPKARSIEEAGTFRPSRLIDSCHRALPEPCVMDNGAVAAAWIQEPRSGANRERRL